MTSAPDDAAVGEILVSEKKLSAADFEKAREAHRTVGGDFCRLLVELGIVLEADVYGAVSRLHGVPLVRAERFPKSRPDWLDFNLGFLLSHSVLPLGTAEGDADAFEFAMSRPNDAQALNALRLVTGRNPKVAIGLPSEIKSCLELLYLTTPEESLSVEEGRAEAAEFIDQLRDMASEAPIIQRVSQILNQAIDQRASDIHIESYESMSVVRLRVDGELIVIDEIESKDAPAIVSRIKILSQLDIAERRLPQDGRTKVRVRGKEIDARISTMPTQFGESVVIRLLEKNPELLTLQRLDFRPVVLAALEGILKIPHGVFLVTGPTGSGKSTTLYAALSAMEGHGLKMLTVEDPVEYRLPWLNQVQAQPQIGLTFAKALRGFLRQDPDIIMIGEMRDRETAEISVQAALTGHLVLSTLHTNSAAGAIVRLINMGVEPYLIAASTVGVLAQRLVRRLCGQCKSPLSPEESNLAAHSLGRREVSGRVFYKAVGCEHCRGTGYRGRLAIHELLPMTSALKNSILEQKTGLRVDESDFVGGSLLADGAEKAALGLTTAEEVLRVAQQND